MTEPGMCACGRPLHYSIPRLRAFIEDQNARTGETVIVTTPEGSWEVQRHYIALHGLKADDLPTLGFKRVGLAS